MATKRRKTPKTDEDGNDFITMGFRCYRKHALLIDRAAARQKTSNSAYMRLVVLTQACADIGVPPPDYSSVVGSPSLISEAARKKGLTVAEFTKKAVQEAAAKALADERTSGKGRVRPLPLPDDED